MLSIIEKIVSEVCMNTKNEKLVKKQTGQEKITKRKPSTVKKDTNNTCTNLTTPEQYEYEEIHTKYITV